MASISGAAGHSAAIAHSAGNENVVSGGTTNAGSLGLASTTSFAGTHANSAASAPATSGSNLVVHFQDGSSLTVVGVHHIDTSFVH